MKYKKCFTLVELLVVIAIISILASVTVIGMSNVKAAARDTKRRSDLAMIYRALTIRYITTNSYKIPNSGNLPGTSIGIFDKDYDGASSLTSIAQALVNDGTLPTVIVDPLNVSPNIYYYAGSATQFTMYAKLEQINDANIDGWDDASSQRTVTIWPPIATGVNFSVGNGY